MRNFTICMSHIKVKSGVRRIPISTTSLTGEVLGSEFESSLERDLILLFAWSKRLEWFQSQPVKIQYASVDGKQRRYTPDLLVNFAQFPGLKTKPILCEVKYREDLRKNWCELRPKFRAARNYCLERWMEFRIYDEHRIRTERLWNIQFLWRYRFSDDRSEIFMRVIDGMRALGPSRLSDIVDAAFADKTEKSQAIWSFWCGVAHDHIAFDINRRINSETLFWLPDWRRESHFTTIS